MKGKTVYMVATRNGSFYGVWVEKKDAEAQRKKIKTDLWLGGSNDTVYVKPIPLL